MKRPIRVAHIMGKWVGGGVEAIVMNYYRNIDKTKIQFDFICDSDSTCIPYEEITKLGGKIFIIPPYQKIFKYHHELKRILKTNNYQIVHSHINTLSVFSLYAAKCAGVPIRIAHSHSTTNKKEFKKNIMKQLLKPFSKVFATDYFCCSELAGIFQFGEKEYKKGNVYLLNNAINISKFQYNPKIRVKKRKELNISEETLVIGHIGRFVPVKNHDFLIEIFKEVHNNNKNSLLLLIGTGPLDEKIKAKAKALNIEDKVIFLGPRNDTNELYQVMDVFLLPSLYEGLPVVGVEAQSSGLICFFSNEVTKEAKLIKTTEYISLAKTSKYWSNIILAKYQEYNRQNTLDEVIKKGFNILTEVKKLENKYLTLLANKE